MSKWEVVVVGVHPGVQADLERLTEYLNDGWEPFSGSTAISGHYFYLRRLR